MSVIGRATLQPRARRKEKVRPLAERYGYAWSTDLDAPVEPGGLLVNVTPIGMAGGDETEELPFAAEVVARAAWVIDVVAVPPETPLLRMAVASGTPVITGTEIMALQAAEQFAIYTGVRPTAAQAQAASAYATYGL